MADWTGYVIAFGMLLVASVQTICLQNNFQMTFVAGMRIRTAIIGAVYRKVIDDRKLIQFGSWCMMVHACDVACLAGDVDYLCSCYVW